MNTLTTTTNLSNPQQWRSYNLMPRWREILRCPTAYDDQAAIGMAKHELGFANTADLTLSLTNVEENRRFGIAVATHYDAIVGRSKIPGWQTAIRWSATAIGYAPSVKESCKGFMKALWESGKKGQPVIPPLVIPNVSLSCPSSHIPNLLELISYYVANDQPRSGGTTMHFSSGGSSFANPLLLSAMDATLSTKQARNRITWGMLQLSVVLFANSFLGTKIPASWRMLNDQINLEVKTLDNDVENLDLKIVQSTTKLGEHPAITPASYS